MGPPEEPPTLSLLPEGVLHRVMSLLAAEEGGSGVRATCSWLRSAFDRCNTRLELRRTPRQLPASFPARLLDLVRHSPCVSSLTLAEGMTWSQVLEAGGPAVLHRLQRLSVHCPSLPDLQALAACTRLQLLLVLGQLPQQPALQLQPLAASSSTLRHLEIGDCSCVRNLSPLAACTALRHLVLGACRRLADITPLAARLRLPQLGSSLHDLSPLAACTILQTLHIKHYPRVADLAPLAACVALQHLDLSACCRISDLAPLAACVDLRQLILAGCCNIHDLSPLAACVALHSLDLRYCVQVATLAPLASCVGLRVLAAMHCQRMRDLDPLAACTELQELVLWNCGVDLGPLLVGVGLQELSLGNVNARNLGPLAACVELKELVLHGCPNVQDLSPLAACLGLERLRLLGCPEARGQGVLGGIAAPENNHAVSEP